MSKNQYLEKDHGEGFFEIDNYSLFYRRFGYGDEVLLGLHGGPGMPHDYLLPLADHASDDLTVYLYDQFGVGRSDRPSPGDFDRYTVDHYREEVEKVRKAIGKSKIHIYGQSWGGMLALEYVLAYQEHVKSLILANTLADTKTAYESMRNMINELSAEDRKKIEHYEARRAFDSPEYENVLMKIYKKHVCRADPFPREVSYTLENTNLDVYGLMWGPNEYVLMDTARLRGWDVRDRLHEITVPTLVLTGRYDEIAPEIAKDIAERIPNAKLYEFTNSSHMSLWDEPKEHYRVVDRFLRNYID